MRVRLPSFDLEVEAALRIAKEAGKILLEHYEKPNGIAKKADGSLVSDVDKMASAYILKELKESFPTYGMLDEELQEDQNYFEKEFCWVIDPLDDTAGYLHKRGDSYGIIIGLMHQLQPIVGVTYRPSSDELLYAVKGQGAYFLQNEIARRISVSADKYVHLLLGHNGGNPELEKLVKEIQPAKITKKGGAIKIVDIAQGIATLYLSPRLTTQGLWDICGTSLILQEAGGRITDLDGLPLEYTKKTIHQGIIASNGVIHQSILDFL